MDSAAVVATVVWSLPAEVVVWLSAVVVDGAGALAEVDVEVAVVWAVVVGVVFAGAEVVVVWATVVEVVFSEVAVVVAEVEVALVVLVVAVVVGAVVVVDSALEVVVVDEADEVVETTVVEDSLVAASILISCAATEQDSARSSSWTMRCVCMANECENERLFEESKTKVEDESRRRKD